MNPAPIPITETPDFGHPILRATESMFAGMPTCMNDIFRELAAEKPVSATPSMSTKSTRRVKLKLQERDGNNCWLCARPMPDDDRTLEHLTPLSLGGSHDLDNLVLCHFTCNRELGNVSLEKKLARKAKRQKGRCDDQY